MSLPDKVGCVIAPTYPIGKLAAAEAEVTIANDMVRNKSYLPAIGFKMVCKRMLSENYPAMHKGTGRSAGRPSRVDRDMKHVDRDTKQSMKSRSRAGAIVRLWSIKPIWDGERPGLNG